jgi:hypothetical protein
MSLSKAWDGYLGLLATNPIPTKALTSFIISGLSDLTAQLISNSKGGVSPQTILEQALIGGCYTSPMVHFWYILLEGVMKGWEPSSALTIFIKLLLDQLTFTPVLLFGYLFITSYLKKQKSKDFWEQFQYSKGNFFQILFTNWKVWPIVNIISFRYVPVNLRVLFGNIVGFFWGIYLILQSSKKSAPKIEASAVTRETGVAFDPPASSVDLAKKSN